MHTVNYVIISVGFCFLSLVASAVSPASAQAQLRQKGKADSEPITEKTSPSSLLIITPEIVGLGRENGPRFPSRRALPDAPLSVIATLDSRPAGIALSKDDRLFVSIASAVGDRDDGQGVVRELLPDGTSRPFPPAWFAADRDPSEQLTQVHALAADSRGVLWILDSGASPTVQPKLVGWNLKEDSLYRVIFLPAPITNLNSSLRSVAIDAKREMAYIADQGRADFVGAAHPAIIAVDLKTGLARRAFEDHYSLNADGGDFVIAGEPLLAPDGKGAVVRPSLGIVSVAIDPTGEALLFGAANARSVFRIPLDALADKRLSSAQLGERVTRVGDKPPSQGIAPFNDKFILVSDVNNNGIGAVFPDGRYELLTRSEECSWPTTFARGNRGEFYLVSSQLHRAPLFHRGDDQSQRPFLVLRFRPEEVKVETENKPAQNQNKQKRTR